MRPAECDTSGVSRSRFDINGDEMRSTAARSDACSGFRMGFVADAVHIGRLIRLSTVALLARRC
jgi:hypothetical protein